MANLDKKINEREACRTQTSYVIKKIETELVSETVTQAKLLGLKNNLVGKLEQLNNLNDEILGLLDADKVRKDVLESMEFSDPTHELLAEITLKLQALAVNPVSVDQVNTGSIKGVSTRCKLPKFELPVFKGDPLAWQGFWDQFSTAIHENEDITDIDRFNYLKRYLGGQALETISGLTLSSKNYEQAVRILTERFGNPQVLISAHMDCLIRMKKVSHKSDVKTLRKLYNGVENCTRNLSTLNLDVSAYGSLLIPLLKEKLPDELNMAIARRFGSSVWSLDLLMIFFNDELTAYESCKPISTQSSSEKKEKNLSEVYTASCLYGQASKHLGIKECLYCSSSEHLANQCKTVTNVAARKVIIFKQGRCFVCLAKGHRAKNCTSNYSCKRCKKRHHISICEGDEGSTVQHTNLVSSTNGVLLQTASAEISDLNDSKQKYTRILFDSGSQRSYLSKDLCKRLNLKPLRKERVVIKTFGQGDAKVQTLEVFQIRIRYKNKDGYYVVNAYAVPTVCSPLVNQNIELVKAKYPQVCGLALADSNASCENLDVDVLIGLDFYHEFFTGKVRRGQAGPFALETKLGWVLSGNFVGPKDQSQHCLFTHAMKVAVEKDNDVIKDKLERFWEIESVGNEEPSVIDDFKNHIYHDGSRYVTRLPFKPDHDDLPDNYVVSQKRLVSTVKRLKAKGIYEGYDKIFKEYEKEGIIEKVPNDEIFKESGTVHYLPHRAVVREDKQTTKIRAVFDASCKVNGPSLNDCLYSGPNLLSKIFDVLFRFRLNKIAIVADIKQAFLNVSIDSQHVDFLRFLWFENNKETIYRFLRVVFGVTSSPFLLNGTIRNHLDKNLSGPNSEIISKLSEDLYVDDTTTGCNSVEEGIHFQKIAISVMQEAGFELRKWLTNEKTLQRFFDRGEGYDQVIGDDTTFAKSHVNGQSISNHHKVLGIEWDVDTDEFLFNFNDLIKKSEEGNLTKRKVLSLSASLYDPIGMISPITAQIKTLFQRLCIDKSGWDDTISDDIQNRWNSLVEKIKILGIVKIPRVAFVGWNEALLVEIHGFSDSSFILYCGVVYVRVRYRGGVKVFFWTSKTKVAPLQDISIPRLELLGCLLLSRLIKDVDRSLANRIKIDRVVCWTDSTVALCWIKGKEKTWKPWVENRVVKVRKVVPQQAWFHVPGTQNPADEPTRDVEDFVKLFEGRWFKGPSFLSDNNISYTDTDFNDCLSDDAQKEMRASCDIHNVMTITEHDKALDLHEIVEVTRFSSLQKIINVIAYVFRFINNNLAKLKKRGFIKGTLSFEEVTKAFNFIIKSEQSAMQKDETFEKTKSNLRLYEDENGFYRVKSRFGESNLTDNEKAPMLLRKDSHITSLIIRNAHEEVLHFGVETTLAKIRERFWIIRGRNVVRRLLRRCVLCKRFQGRTMIPPETPDLPDFRVNHITYAFETTGLDFAGPLLVKNKGLSCSKVYILLFTCASSRAIHLELTPDMKSPAFIRGFKRFVARRGKPQSIINDNFKTFKSAKVKAYMLKLQVKQKFILPASPWWGGFYERLVRSVKTALKKILRKSYLTFEELQTVLCEIEGTINARPLCYASEEDLGETITPNHLIYGRSLSNVEARSTYLDGMKVSKRVKHINKVIDHFWERFKKSYLNELRQRHQYDGKKKIGFSKLYVNDVVIIRDDTPTPRTQWRMGKIEELIYGKDGNIRGAQLKVNSNKGFQTHIYRPVQKLIPFEIADSDNDKDDNNDIKEQDVQVNDNSQTIESSDGAQDSCRVESRLRRRAAIEGQELRRLRDIYN